MKKFIKDQLPALFLIASTVPALAEDGGPTALVRFLDEANITVMSLHDTKLECAKEKYESIRKHEPHTIIEHEGHTVVIPHENTKFICWDNKNNALKKEDVDEMFTGAQFLQLQVQ